jgi:hypothetical protein
MKYIGLFYTLIILILLTWVITDSYKKYNQKNKEKMKKLLQKIWNTIKNIFNKVEEKTRELIPVAIKIVEGVKKAVDSPVDDIILSIITTAIPGDADDKLVKKVKTVVEHWIPKLLIELQLIEDINNLPTTNDKMKAIFEKLKLSSNETKNVVYHGLASLVLEKLSDGELSWKDAVVISEFYYQNIAKTK